MVMTARDDQPTPEVHGGLAGVQTRHRAGARLVRRRRQRLRPCADIVIASDDAVIGTPYARMWGAYLTGMWLYRLSLAKVKWHSLTGEPLTGKEAAAVELINESVPFERLEARVNEVAAKLARSRCPNCRRRSSSSTRPTRTWAWPPRRRSAAILDGLMRNTPDALEFIDTAANEGVRAAIERRDGPWGDYSQAPPERRPDPYDVIEPLSGRVRRSPPSIDTSTPNTTSTPPAASVRFSH